MNTAFERLQTASHKLAEALYSQAGHAAGDASRAASRRRRHQPGDGGSTAGRKMVMSSMPNTSTSKTKRKSDASMK